MRATSKKFRFVVVTLVLFVAPLALLYAQAGQNHNNFLSRSVHWLTGPVQSAVTVSWQAGHSLVHRYLWLVNTAEQDQQLRKQIGRLKLENAALQEQARENMRLQGLLQLREGLQGTRSVAAQIIAVGQSSDYRTLRINRGLADGVRRRAGVIAVDGVVGRVVSVSRHYADVLLLNDASSRLDVESARSRARGMLHGAGKNCHIDAMDRTLDIAAGDTVLSSGLDGVFPKGLRVGLVRSVQRPSIGLYLDAEIELFVHFNELEQVLVLIHAPESLTWPQISSLPDAADTDVAKPESKPAVKPAVKPNPSPQI